MCQTKPKFIKGKLINGFSGDLTTPVKGVISCHVRSRPLQRYKGGPDFSASSVNCGKSQGEVTQQPTGKGAP